MAQTMAEIANKPSWVDLSSADAGSSREFYGKLFGWDVEVNPDPQYGGYALARIGGKDAAGIGPKMDPTPRRRGPVHRHRGHRRAGEAGDRRRRHGRHGPVRRRRPGSDGRLPGSGGAFISAWQGTAHGRLPDRRAELVPLGRAQRSRRRAGACRSTRRCSAGRSRRARWARARRTTTSSRSTPTASAARGR